MAKVLIQDIAKALGMSRNTVSKALKNDSAVLESTRNYIISKAYDMGYQKFPPEVQDSLKNNQEGIRNQEGNGKVKKYAIVMGEFAEDDFWNGMVHGISDKIKKENGSCLLVLVTPEDVKSGILPAVLLEGDFEGIMCITVFPGEYESKIRKLGIPIVFVDTPVLKLPYKHKGDIILIEGAQSVYTLTADLIKRGCRQIGFIGDITYCESILDRWRGFKAAMEDAGLGLEEQYCMTEAKEDHYYEAKELQEMLDGLQKLPDALVCANDLIAIAVVQYCKRRNIAVPEQMAVTGFDDKRECTIIDPPITTVNTTNRQIGIRIAEQLLWRLENPFMRNEIVMIATEPCFRKSSAR